MTNQEKLDELRNKLIDWVTDYKDVAERNALAETPKESADYLITLFMGLKKEILKDIGESLDKLPTCGFADTPLRCLHERVIARLKAGLPPLNFLPSRR